MFRVKLNQLIPSLLLAGVAAGVAGCAGGGKSDAMTAPAAEWRLAAFTGTALTGPSGDALEAPDDAVSVRLEVFAARLPDDLPPLGTGARLIIAEREGHPVLPSTRLTIGTRIGTSEAASGAVAALKALPPAETAVIASEPLALLSGTTVSGLVSAPGGLPRMEILLSRPPDSDVYQLAVIRTELVTLEVEEAIDDAATQPAATNLIQRELALLDLPATPQTIVLSSRLDFPDRPRSPLAWVISIAPGSDDPAHRDAVARSRRLIEDSSRRIAAGSESTGGTATQVRTAVELAEDVRRRRATLVYLASSNAAPIASDVATLAEDGVLETFAARLDRQTHSSMSPAQWSLALDLVALLTLGEMLSAGNLPAELQSVLLIHTGEAGRHAGTIEEIVAGVSNRTDLEARLIAENVIYLTDNSPAARVRAYDWLSSRSAAPPGYDPLADAVSRRAALRATVQASATQPAEPR